MVPEFTPISPSPNVPVVGKIRREQQRNRGRQNQKSESDAPAAEQRHDEQPVRHIDEIV